MQTELQVGSVFGSYVVEAHEPDVCGFAVYRARHQVFDQRVTLRFGTLLAGAAPSSTVHLLDHHGIERVLDHGTGSDGTAFTVAESVEGEPLCAYCDARSLDMKSRVGLLLQAAEALGYAHQHVQPHHNLCADLVLVDATGHVKICGFGLANAGGEQADALEHDLECLGTIGALLLADADSAAGEAPAAWVAGQSTEVQRTLARNRSTTVPRLLRDLRGDLDAVVSHMVGRHTDQYASVDLAAGDLASVLHGRSTRVYRQTRWERLRLWAVFQPTTAVAVAVLLVTALGASAVFARQTATLTMQRRASETRLGELVALSGALETRLYAAASSMPTPAPVRATLVRHTQEALNAATADASLSPELAASVAQQYRALATRSEELAHTSAAAQAEAGRTAHVKNAGR